MYLTSIDEMISRGWGRSALCGAFSTGKVGGGAGIALDLDQPELIVAVPAGTAIRPFRISVQVQGGAIGTDADETELLIAVDSLGLWKGDGSHTDVTPSNLRTDLDKGSACRVAQAETGDLLTVPGYAVMAAADPVLDMELARMVQTMDLGTNAGHTANMLNLVYEPDYPPILVGPCTLFVYFGGTVATVGGFVQAQWVEGPKSEMVPIEIDA